MLCFIALHFITCMSQMLCFFHIEGKRLHQPKDDTGFIAVVWSGGVPVQEEGSLRGWSCSSFSVENVEDNSRMAC